jgi:hypothetical protein
LKKAILLLTPKNNGHQSLDAVPFHTPVPKRKRGLMSRATLLADVQVIPPLGQVAARPVRFAPLHSGVAMPHHECGEFGTEKAALSDIDAVLGAGPRPALHLPRRQVPAEQHLADSGSVERLDKADEPVLVHPSGQ